MCALISHPGTLATGHWSSSSSSSQIGVLRAPLPSFVCVVVMCNGDARQVTRGVVNTEGQCETCEAQLVSAPCSHAPLLNGLNGGQTTVWRASLCTCCGPTWPRWGACTCDEAHSTRIKATTQTSPSLCVLLVLCSAPPGIDGSCCRRAAQARGTVPSPHPRDERGESKSWHQRLAEKVGS